jgi:hypothetical protein
MEYLHFSVLVYEYDKKKNVKIIDPFTLSTEFRAVMVP